MNKKEKLNIMKNCQIYYQEAIMTQFTKPNKHFLNLGAGKALKKIIEDLIDCQSNPYYDMYLYIVKLANTLE